LIHPAFLPEFYWAFGRKRGGFATEQKKKVRLVSVDGRFAIMTRLGSGRTLLVASGFVALLGATPSHAADSVLYQWSWIPDGVFAPTSSAIEKGFYKEVGIDLKTATGRGSGDAVKKVAGGGAMFGDGDLSAVMVARVREGAPVKCLMYWHDHSPHALFVLESSGIKSFKDLAGKTLATTPGNSHRNYFPITAKMAGLDPESVKWTTVDTTTMPSLLVNKKVDAVPYFTSNAAFVRPQVEAMGDKLRIIPFADYGFDIYAYCVFTRDDVIKEKPDLVRRFVAAMQKSYHWAKDNSEEAIRIHSKRFPDTKPEQNMDGWKDLMSYMYGKDGKKPWSGHFDMEKVQRTYDVVAQSQGLDPKVDVKQFIDDSFLPPKR
jgi:NitT/TauT family transport system substrate-binding protein